MFGIGTREELLGPIFFENNSIAEDWRKLLRTLRKSYNGKRWHLIFQLGETPDLFPRNFRKWVNTQFFNKCIKRAISEHKTHSKFFWMNVLTYAYMKGHHLANAVRIFKTNLIKYMEIMAGWYKSNFSFNIFYSNFTLLNIHTKLFLSGSFT